MSIQSSINQIAGIIGGKIEEANIEAENIAQAETKEAEKVSKEAEKQASANSKASQTQKANEAITQLQEQMTLQTEISNNLQDRIDFLNRRANDPNFAVDALKNAGVLSNRKAKDISHKLKIKGDSVDVTS